MKWKIDGAYAIPDCDDKPCIETSQITYVGSNLPCTGIQNNSNLTIDIQKIDSKICELYDMYFTLTCELQGVITVL